ncbi:MAG: hypothetical protein WD187_00430 [Candidatus Woykebacteria bacterium]
MDLAWDCPGCGREGRFYIKVGANTKEVGEAVLEDHRRKSPKCEVFEAQFDPYVDHAKQLATQNKN